MCCMTQVRKCMDVANLNANAASMIEASVCMPTNAAIIN